MEKIEMSQKQFKTYRLAQDVLEGKLSVIDFALMINKSYRQAQRIISKIKEIDFLGVIHGNCSRPSHNKTSVELELLVIDLLRNKYRDFNLTHFREKLIENENIDLKKDVIHRIAKLHGLVKNPKRRGRRVFKLRQRMPKEGMMIQFDGSEHLWFGDNKSVLIGGIDDATSKVVAAEFFKGETSMNSMKVIREIIDTNGLPESFYMDQAGIYGKVEHETESQISRAFEQTGIRLILANSSQAKGRVERLWRTFQDRLIAELSFNSIATMEEANDYLKNHFLASHNERFSIRAEFQEKAYRKNVFGNLDNIFCRKIQRKIMNGNAFSWENITWVIEDTKSYYGREININTHIDGSYSFDIMGKKVHCKVHKVKRLNDYGNKSKLRKVS